MKKRFATVLLIIFIVPVSVFAQTETSDFSREQGYFIRPELYGALLAEFGYQINPFVQFSLGAGTEFGDQATIPELVLGIRAYATDTKWTAFFDYHIGMLLVGQYSIPDHRFTAGASYKNLDFGGGIMYANIGGTGIWSPCLNIGYNFRFPRNK